MRPISLRRAGVSLRRRWADVSLRGKTLLVVAIPTVALVLTVAAFASAQRSERRASDHVTQTLEVHGRIAQIRRTLLDAESGVRGYLLTGNADWLEPFETAQPRLTAVLDELATLVVDDEGQIERLAALEPVVGRRLDVMGEARRSRQILLEDSPASQAILEEGHALMQQATAILDEMGAEQDAFLVIRRERLDTLRERSSVFVGGTLALGGAGALLATMLLTSGVVRRLRLVQAGATRLAAGKPLEGMPGGRDEVGQVAAALTEARSLLVEREQALDQARSFLEHLIETGPVLMLRLAQPGGATEYASPNAAKILGCEPGEVAAGDNWWRDHVHPDDLPGLDAQLATALETRAQVIEGEWRLLRKDGTVLWAASIVIPQYDAAGSATELLVYCLDVTGRKLAEAERDQTEEDLRRAVAHLDDLYNNSPCGYHSVDGDGNFLRINDTELRWLGYTREELVGTMGLLDVLTPAGAETFRSRFPAFKKDGLASGIEVELVRRDGTRLPVEITATAVYDDEGRFLATRSTVVDATTRREIELAREAAREAAETANRAKSEFLSRMSHELRTPLNAILGFSQLLQLDSLTREQSENVRYISGAGRHLLQLINEILDVSRIEAGTMTLSPEPVGVADVLSELIALVGPLANGRRLTVEAVPGKCDLHVLADRQRLKQVLLNLLSNAIKYNRDGGTMGVRCEAVGGGRARITVWDTGYGISPEHVDRLFRPFDRLGAEGGAIEGTGMGLALSKGLVEAMGGSVGVESALDVGSTFWVELTLADEAAEVVGPLRAAPEKSLNGAARTIVQIDDNAPNIRLVEQILARRDSYRLIPAMQGRIGLELARQHSPDLVLLDVHLPDMTGLEVLRLLRTYPETRDTPIIVLSADATKVQTARFIDAGAAGYLTKPLDVAEFLSVLDATLKPMLVQA